MNIEDLDYPLFETTDEEKEVLRKALVELDKPNSRSLLCHLVRDIVGVEFVNYPLLDKIMKALDRTGSLFLYLTRNMEVYQPQYIQFEKIYKIEPRDIRKIWIKLLLEYKG